MQNAGLVPTEHREFAQYVKTGFISFYLKTFIEIFLLRVAFGENSSAIKIKQEPVEPPAQRAIPQKFHDCIIGGKLIKAIVKPYEPSCTMSMGLYKKLTAENLKTLTKDLIPLKVGDTKFYGQITTIINTNTSSKFININLKEGDDNFVILTERKARELCLKIS